MTTGGSISSTVMKKFLIGDIEEALDKELPLKHGDLSAKIDDLLTTQARTTINQNLVQEFVDSSYSPIIMVSTAFRLVSFCLKLVSSPMLSRNDRSDAHLYCHPMIFHILLPLHAISPAQRQPTFL